MNEQEMLNRLARGENPLDVAIIKWKELVTRLEDTGFQDIKEDDFNSPTCALCSVYVTCSKCVYCLHYGYSCAGGSGFSAKTAWTRFVIAYDGKELVQAIQSAQGVVKELEAIKNTWKIDQIECRYK